MGYPLLIRGTNSVSEISKRKAGEVEITSSFTDKLAEQGKEELAQHLRKSARYAIFNAGGLRRWPVMKAIMPVIRRRIGIDEMIDEFASEMYLALQAGESMEDAYATASRLCQRSWRRQYDYVEAREWSIQEAQEYHAPGSDNPEAYVDPAAIYSEMAQDSAEAEFFGHDDAWGPKHVEIEKMLAILTPAQRAGIEAEAGRFSQTEAAEFEGIGRQAMNKRIKAARDKIHRALETGALVVDEAILPG